MIALLFSVINSYAQTKTPVSTNDGYTKSFSGKIKTKFTKPEIELKKSGLISNVLKIINIGSDNQNFTLDVLIPLGWNSIIDPNKVYNINVNDTIIIPILLIPSKLAAGNSEMIINSFLLDIDGQQIGDNSFILKTKKKIDWDLSVKTANRFYFKNNEYNKKFEYSIVNKGNYKQDIAIKHNIPKNDLYLSDTSFVKIEKIKDDTSVSLEVGEEADFSYYASAIQDNERNKKKISNTKYTPYENKYFKNYDLVISSIEDKSSSDIKLKKTAKLSFVKLPNQIEMQPYGYPSIPLTMDLYFQNILGDYPFMSLSLRGIKQINLDANLVYSANFNFSQSYYNSKFAQDIPWYLGYFDDRKSVEIGQVNSNVIGIQGYGRGVRAGYSINNSNSVSAFYTRSSDNSLNYKNKSYGITYTFNSSNFNLNTQYGRSENNSYNRFTDVLTITPKIRLFKKHSLSASISQSTTQETTINQKKVGYLYRAGLSSSISKGFKININGQYTDSDFGSGGIERMIATHRTMIKLNRTWSAYINNNYQKSTTQTTANNTYYKNESFTNRFILSKKTKYGASQNGVYYDYKSFLSYKIKSRGLSYRFSTYHAQKNLQSSYFLRAGYTKQILDTPTENNFSFDFTTLTRFRTWNYIFKYNYGNVVYSTYSNTTTSSTPPQLIRASVQNQYTFKNRRFILESTSSYTYRNTASNNSFSISPELYYFSKTHWRYSLRTSYTYNSSDYSSIYESLEENQYSTNLNGKTKSSNITIGMSIRKEFGIPIPFAKKRSTNTTFIAFKDANGNGIKDRDETPLNNVIISLGTKEVITTRNGIAEILKAPRKKFKFKVLSLEDQKGWFPQIPDSIIIDQEERYYVPFVRGVKLYGDVIMDRQKIAITDDRPMDLSRIKITATKDQSYTTLTNDKGHFEFYLPNGQYTITMDDGILSSNLRLSRNNIPVVLKNNQDGYYMSFYVIEKRRKVIIRDFSKKKR